MTAKTASDAQIGRLAGVLMDEFGGPTGPESAVDMAIRTMRELRQEAIEARDVILDLTMQFSIESREDGKTTLSTGGLSTLEGAFAFLGWENPHVLGEND